MNPPLPQTDHLLIVPPFAHLSWPSLGVHVLAACAGAAGHSVGILYANCLFAKEIGTPLYADLCNAPGKWLLGERIFRAAAYGLDPIGADAEDFLEGLHHPLHPLDGERASRYVDQLSDAVLGGQQHSGASRYHAEELKNASAAAVAFAEQLGRAIASQGYRTVGASSTFEQTSASVALLRVVKQRAPQIRTLLGGANCEGTMADGLAALDLPLDHLFSGESEVTYVSLLDGLDRGERPDRVLRGPPTMDLDALPTPDFQAFFAQRAAVLPNLDAPTWISYETSRGCWWGEKSHCTFCGLNGYGMGFRQKSADRVIADLNAFLERYPTRQVCMTDNIMPHGYHKTLVPRLPTEAPGLHIFYEQKANLTLSQVRALQVGGVAVIQPGIESLATSLLDRMAKGVKGRQNIALLRYARSVGMVVKWNLLGGLPGDLRSDYELLRDLVPLLTHLYPPNALSGLMIDRFSPYFVAPADHGIDNLRPWPAYAAIYPRDADHAALAYHFDGDYPTATTTEMDVMAALFQRVTAWRDAWTGREPPVLQARAMGPRRFGLWDSRGLGGPSFRQLTPAQARTVLVGGHPDRTPLAGWAVREGYAVMLDGRVVPLAVAPPGLLAQLETERTKASAPASVLPAG